MRIILNFACHEKVSNTTRTVIIRIIFKTASESNNQLEITNKHRNKVFKIFNMFKMLKKKKEKLFKRHSSEIQMII